MATQLEFDNLRALILSCERAVTQLIQYSSEEYLVNNIPNAVPFLIGLGQANSASTYAVYGKISKDLAYATMVRWSTMHAKEIQVLINEVEDFRRGA